VQLAEEAGEGGGLAGREGWMRAEAGEGGEVDRVGLVVF